MSMQDFNNARQPQPQEATAPVITDAEIAAFQKWRQEQLGQATAGPAAAPVAAPAAIPDTAYDLHVGQLVQVGLDVGLVTARGPVVDSTGATVAGYKFVTLGVPNDTALPAEVLGITAL